MSKYVNPFTGSKVEIKQYYIEDSMNLSMLRSLKSIEDENERFVLFEDGTLIKKTISETKYFKNNFSF
jgi:hypothetical protein